MFHRSYHFVQELKVNSPASENHAEVLASNSQPAKRAITAYNFLLTPDWHCRLKNVSLCLCASVFNK